MMKTKLTISLLLTVFVVVTQVAAVYAAPAVQTVTPISCTVQSISTSTDSAGVTTVTVTCADGTTVKLSADNAVTLGLVTQNPDGTFTVNDAMVGQTISIDPSLIESDPCVLPTDTSTTGDTSGDTSTGGVHPVAAALTSFFCESLGMDYQTIQDYHDLGLGYGVIAQACFMAQSLGGDAALCKAILDAKKSGDFSGITLSDGTHPRNWGQLRKAAFDQESSSLTNLGAIMSGRAGGDGNGHGHGGGHGHGKP
jgi:hypothetical protein